MNTPRPNRAPGLRARHLIGATVIAVVAFGVGALVALGVAPGLS